MEGRDQAEDRRCEEEGRPGPPVNAGKCVKCGVRPKNATIVHRHENTGHVCCCIQCAETLEICPICRAPIQAVIRHFVS